MLHVERRHTAGKGQHVVISCDHRIYQALIAAVQVAYDNAEDDIPDEYRESVDELWQGLVLNTIT